MAFSSDAFEHSRKNDFSLPRFDDVDSESAFGRVRSVSGPVVIVDGVSGLALNEVVRVGTKEILGEVIKLRSDRATVQLFGDSYGLSVNDPVLPTRRPLTVELGPGILNNYFDGIQRSLPAIAEHSDLFIPNSGAGAGGLDKSKTWFFQPHQRVKVGDHIREGDVYGVVEETTLLPNHSIMLPPKAKGTVTYIAPAGEYTLRDAVLEIEFQGEKKRFTMMQSWPIRQPRPYVEKLRSNRPLLMGFRVLDALYPCLQGGTVTMPAAFSWSKLAVIQSTVAMSNSDVAIFVGCGERGSELAEQIIGIQEMRIYLTNDREELVMNRTSVIANTNNTPVAIRDASLYTGLTLSEYFRDMGLNATMLADSTSRWAESLCEISASLGEMPGDSGYPTYVVSRLAAVYDRAGKVSCLGSPSRQGALTMITSVSPKGGDFGEPFTNATLEIAKGFWALDKRMAQRKHFPSINWLTSYSRDIKDLDDYYDADYPEFTELRKTCNKILDREDELTETLKRATVAQLSETDKLTLDVAKMIREDFLQQNQFSEYDRYCPFYKAFWMLKNIITFYELGIKAIESSMSSKHKITWDYLKGYLGNAYSDQTSLVYSLSAQKFQKPSDGEQQLVAFYKNLNRTIHDSFASL